MSCNSQDGCCGAPMCANAGSHLDCIFTDIGNLITTTTGAIAQAKKPTTVAGALGTFSANQILVFGLIALIVILVVEAHK